MALNQTTFAYALKQLWPQKRAAEMTYKDNPLLAMMPKKEDAGGDTINIAVRYADPQGRSSVFATAQANKGNQVGVKFQLTRASDYGLASVANETVEASKSDQQALLRAMDSEIEAAYNGLVRSAAIKLYGNGGGAIGQIATAGITGEVITLANTQDITNFEKGMVIQASTADGTSGSLRDSGDTATISSVDRDLGKITFATGGVASINGIAAADYLFQHGDFGAGMKGLGAWLPSSAPSATTFFGVDRTGDVTRLGGVRYDGSALTIQEAIIKGLARLSREGGSPDYGFTSYDHWSALELELGSKVQYVDVESNVGFGFRGIRVNGPKKAITILPDMNCTAAVCYLLQMNTWKLYSVGKVPHIIDLDGNKFLREASADAYEVRLAYYANPGCESPGYNARVALPTLT